MRFRPLSLIFLFIFTLMLFVEHTSDLEPKYHLGECLIFQENSHGSSVNSVIQIEEVSRGSYHYNEWLFRDSQSYLNDKAIEDLDKDLTAHEVSNCDKYIHKLPSYWGK